MSCTWSISNCAPAAPGLRPSGILHCTGVEEVDNLVAMLIQADRFGTSIADSLRVHSDSLRTKRAAHEEAAAKIAVKLPPADLLHFPSMLLVLLGPAFIGIHRVLLPTMAGG